MTSLRFLVLTSLVLATGFAAEPPPGLPFTTFRAQFAAGDSIVIEQVRLRGSSLRIGEIIPVGSPETPPETTRGLVPRIGDTVIVRGRYELASQPQARIGLSLTTRGPSGPEAVSPGARQSVRQGSGTFNLEYVIRREGELHVTFFPLTGGTSFGGVYFKVKP
ncbi:MAG: hypothetical protein WCQ89_03415 [Verrucomicrobiota bacterium]